MAGKRKFALEKVLAAIKDTGGLKTEICQRLKCSRPTLDSYIKEDDIIAQAYEDECHAVTDMARGALFEAIESRQPWAVMFYLDRKDPEYHRQSKSEISGEVKSTGGVLVVPADLDMDEWEQAVKRQQSEMFKKHG